MDKIIRAWKHETDGQGLSAGEQTVLPANLAEEIDLTDQELEAVYGAWGEDIENENDNTATSSSTSSATGGNASASTGAISVPIFSI